MKFLSILLLSLLFSLLIVGRVDASLVTVTKEGEVVVNVLASETTLSAPSSSSLEIKEIKPSNEGVTSGVSLSNENGKIALNIVTSDGEKNLDVTGLGGDLIEVEERPEVNKVKIGFINGQFAIVQEEIVALTNFPININPENAKISLSTPSGLRYLSIFPKDAYVSGLRAKTLSKLKEGTNLTIIEAGGKELQYQLTGEKTLNLFNLISLDVPVGVTISAFNGEVVNIDQPIWLKVLGFMFG